MKKNKNRVSNKKFTNEELRDVEEMVNRIGTGKKDGFIMIGEIYGTKVEGVMFACGIEPKVVLETAMRRFHPSEVLHSMFDVFGEKKPKRKKK